jgi:hypothetical protein
MNEPTIDPAQNAVIIDNRLFVDIDAITQFLRSEDGPYLWTRRAADAMKVSEDAYLADGMLKIIEHIEITAMNMREELDNAE